MQNGHLKQVSMISLSPLMQFCLSIDSVIDSSKRLQVSNNNLFAKDTGEMNKKLSSLSSALVSIKPAIIAFEKNKQKVKISPSLYQRFLEALNHNKAVQENYRAIEMEFNLKQSVLRAEEQHLVDSIAEIDNADTKKNAEAIVFSADILKNKAKLEKNIQELSLKIDSHCVSFLPWNSHEKKELQEMQAELQQTQDKLKLLSASGVKQKKEITLLINHQTALIAVRKKIADLIQDYAIKIKPEEIKIEDAKKKLDGINLEIELTNKKHDAKVSAEILMALLKVNGHFEQYAKWVEAKFLRLSQDKEQKELVALEELYNYVTDAKKNIGVVLTAIWSPELDNKNAQTVYKELQLKNPTIQNAKIGNKATFFQADKQHPVANDAVISEATHANK